MKQVLIAVLAFTALFGCRKKDDPIAPVKTTGDVRISIAQMAGIEPLELNTKWYANPNGDSLQFTTFNYFISNVRFIKADGSSFAEPESYHLVSQR